MVDAAAIDSQVRRSARPDPIVPRVVFMLGESERLERWGRYMPICAVLAVALGAGWVTARCLVGRSGP